jgi:hypothetical protein
MRWLLILLATTVIWNTDVSSQESSDHKPIAQKEQTSEQKKTAPKNPPASAKQRESAVVQDTRQPADAHTDEKLKIDRQIAEYTRQLSIYTQDLSIFTKSLSQFTLLLVIATVVVALIGIWQGWQLKRSVDLGRAEFIATHRPRVHIRNVVVHPPKDASGQPQILFSPNYFISGQLTVANIGDTPAKITESHCIVHWQQIGLPMERPYEGQTPANPIHDITLQPGESSTVTFQSKDAMSGVGNRIFQCVDNWGIYVMGWIAYEDDLRVKRRTAFCRQWRFPERRFFPLHDDPDYEHEE